MIPISHGVAPAKRPLGSKRRSGGEANSQSSDHGARAPPTPAGWRSAPVGSTRLPFSSRISWLPGVAAISAEVVGRDDDGGAEPVERGEQVQDALRHGRVDVAGRLVGDEQFGAGDDRAGDGDALLLAARQRRRARAGAVGEPDPGEHLAHRALDLVLAMPGDAQRQRDIVERRQMADEAEILEHHADAAAEGGQQVARGVGQFLAEQADPAARRALREVEQFEQRGLARARRAGEEIELPRAKPEVEIAQHFAARAVAQANAVKFDDRAQRSRSLTPAVAHRVLAQRARALPSMDVVIVYHR